MKPIGPGSCGTESRWSRTFVAARASRRSLLRRLTGMRNWPGPDEPFMSRGSRGGGMPLPVSKPYRSIFTPSRSTASTMRSRLLSPSPPPTPTSITVILGMPVRLGLAGPPGAPVPVMRPVEGVVVRFKSGGGVHEACISADAGSATQQQPPLENVLRSVFERVSGQPGS